MTGLGGQGAAGVTGAAGAGGLVGTRAAETAATARMLCAAGLVEAFGHVSARLDGDGLLITPTSPLLAVTADDVVRVWPDGALAAGEGSRAPLEIPLHAAVYRARPDVAAVCRGHGPSMVAWGTRTVALPLLHGLGALAGAEVPVHADLELITTAAAGDAVAATLGDGHAALLLANGGFAVGATLLEAATRLWFTEERARVALAALAAAPGADADAWERRRRHSGVELERAMAWFAARFAPPAPPAVPESTRSHP